MKRTLSLIFILISMASFAMEDGKLVLLIDAGHGGKDPGNLHQTDGLKDEKDLNLEMALKFGSYIDEYLGHKVKIIYTRTTDVFVSLTERAEMANNSNVDYFISIHCNASENPSVQGTETHIHTTTSLTSSKLGHAVQAQFRDRAGRHSRGVKMKSDRQGNLQVLKDTKMPAILIETGFMTNPVEEAYLNSVKGQDLIASAVFRAFRDFIKAKHSIEMRVPNKPEEVAPNQPVYKVQIMASTGPVSLNNPQFLSLDLPVEELQIQNPSSTFTYKYYVGSFNSKKEAKEMLKKVKDGVFKDAFLVKFD